MASKLCKCYSREIIDYESEISMFKWRSMTKSTQHINELFSFRIIQTIKDCHRICIRIAKLSSCCHSFNRVLSICQKHNLRSTDIVFRIHIFLCSFYHIYSITATFVQSVIALLNLCAVVVHDS